MQIIFPCIKARLAITNCEQYMSFFFFQTCNKLVTCYKLSICKLVTKVKTYCLHTIFILGHFFSRNHLSITDIIFLKLPFTYCFSILITVRIQFNYVRYKTFGRYVSWRRNSPFSVNLSNSHKYDSMDIFAE